MTARKDINRSEGTNMRVNVLQHTPNEGPGSIGEWSQQQGHELYIYHPYQFNGNLPVVEETDLLIILGGPMSPNDSLDWILKEQELIKACISRHIPIFGACFGAQQIAKSLGCRISKATYKEVGWAPVYLQSSLISTLPQKLTALHWHEEMFDIPEGFSLLFSSDLFMNQGFIRDNILGLQFHFEPLPDNVREIVINDGDYAREENALQQTPDDILRHGVPLINRQVMFQLLDYICSV